VIPQGAVSVKPRGLPGWKIDYTYRPLSPPVTLHGKKINETIASISWYGGLLPDSQFEEFSISMKLPNVENGTQLYFDTYQSCVGNLSIAWDQRPVNGQEASLPAASVTISSTNSAVQPSAQKSSSSSVVASFALLISTLYLSV
jgi:uncharacterized protein YcnI